MLGGLLRGVRSWKAGFVVLSVRLTFLFLSLLRLAKGGGMLFVCEYYSREKQRRGGSERASSS